MKSYVIPRLSKFPYTRAVFDFCGYFTADLSILKLGCNSVWPGCIGSASGKSSIDWGTSSILSSLDFIFLLCFDLYFYFICVVMLGCIWLKVTVVSSNLIGGVLSQARISYFHFPFSGNKARQWVAPLVVSSQKLDSVLTLRYLYYCHDVP